MEQTSTETKPGYEPPELTVLGTVQELTRVDKQFGCCDGDTFHGTPIANNSTTP